MPTHYQAQEWCPRASNGLCGSKEAPPCKGVGAWLKRWARRRGAAFTACWLRGRPYFCPTLFPELRAERCSVLRLPPGVRRTCSVHQRLSHFLAILFSEESSLVPCPFSLTSLGLSLPPLGHPIQPSMQDQAGSQLDSLTFLLTLGESHSPSHFPSFMSDGLVSRKCLLLSHGFPSCCRSAHVLWFCFQAKQERL